jgi:hypothetical protein
MRWVEANGKMSEVLWSSSLQGCKFLLHCRRNDSAHHSSAEEFKADGAAYNPNHRLSKKAPGPRLFDSDLVPPQSC